jgi:hypothetical protein
MKFARLVCTAIALTMVTGWATWSYACDQDKATTTSAKSAKGMKVSAAYVSATKASGTCTAEMAAHCTAEMAAACKAKMTSATAASAANSKGMKVDAVVASTSGNADACCMGKVSASAASTSGSCAMKGASAAAASANGACAMKTMSAAAAGQCNGHGMGAMASSNTPSDCEACIDGWDCNEALDAAGAHRQAVRLKNGVMYVYTADSQSKVSAVQAAVARRGDHMTRLAAAGDKAHLCAECKSMRGAIASGKLTREVVNIEGGSLTLITSTDPTVVAKIHAMADTKVAARTKS